MSRPGVFYHTPETPEVRRKRTHSEFLHSQNRSHTARINRSHHRPEMSSSSTPNFLEPPLRDQAPPAVRFEGDGFDFRRPIMSTANAGTSNSTMDVIDLTTDDSDSSASFVHTRQLPPLSMPDNLRRHIHEREERARRQNVDARRDTSTTRPNPSSSFLGFDAVQHAQFFDLPGVRQRQETRPETTEGSLSREDSDDSDVVFVGEREVTPPPNRPRATTSTDWARQNNDGRQPSRIQGGLGGLGELIRNGTMGFFPTRMPTSVIPIFHRFGAGSSGSFTFGYHRPRQDRPTSTRPDPDFEVMEGSPLRTQVERQLFPARLDFEAQGFELLNPIAGEEIPYQGPATRNRADSPPYKAPSAPPEGFTRKIEEDTMVVCPNCNEELGRKDYDDLKRQVWVVKSCGHVYCGECTKNRFVTGKTKSAISNGKTPTFKKCVVDGCDKPVHSRTAMLQIYL